MRTTWTKRLKLSKTKLAFSLQFHNNDLAEILFPAVLNPRAELIAIASQAHGLFLPLTCSNSVLSAAIGASQKLGSGLALEPQIQDQSVAGVPKAY